MDGAKTLREEEERSGQKEFKLLLATYGKVLCEEAIIISCFDHLRWAACVAVDCSPWYSSSLTFAFFIVLSIEWGENPACEWVELEREVIDKWSGYGIPSIISWRLSPRTGEAFFSDRCTVPWAFDLYFSEGGCLNDDKFWRLLEHIPLSSSYDPTEPISSIFWGG